MSALLQVEDLRVDFGRRRRVAVDGITLALGEGERVGLIGESGSGKSVTALALMGLLPDHAHVSGSVRWRGRELLGLGDRAMSRLRGDQIGMVFQEPMTALDPTMRVGRQVGEVIRLHDRGGGPARSRVLAMLGRVGLSDPERVAASHPHELSGGQRQRVLMAMALVNSPDLLICDEPTTALDVTVQDRVLTTLETVLDEEEAACLFISHDLAVVARICARVVVMTEGRIVETGRTLDVLESPQHPYTRRLLRAARLDAVTPGDPILLDAPGGQEDQ